MDNGGFDAPSSDSFPLYVYDAGALEIVDSDGTAIESLSLSNVDKVETYTAGSASGKTSQEILASIFNDTDITVVRYAGDGWYEITFHGPGGADTTGYIMGEYISAS